MNLPHFLGEKALLQVLQKTRTRVSTDFGVPSSCRSVHPAEGARWWARQCSYRSGAPVRSMSSLSKDAHRYRQGVYPFATAFFIHASSPMRKRYLAVGNLRPRRAQIGTRQLRTRRAPRARRSRATCSRHRSLRSDRGPTAGSAWHGRRRLDFV